MSPWPSAATWSNMSSCASNRYEGGGTVLINKCYMVPSLSGMKKGSKDVRVKSLEFSRKIIKIYKYGLRIMDYSCINGPMLSLSSPNLYLDACRNEQRVASHVAEPTVCSSGHEASTWKCGHLCARFINAHARALQTSAARMFFKYFLK